MRRHALLYSTVIGVLTINYVAAISLGHTLEQTRQITPIARPHTPMIFTLEGFWQPFVENFHYPVDLLLGQVFVLFARLMGIVATYIGQSSVSGEISR